MDEGYRTRGSVESMESDDVSDKVNDLVSDQLNDQVNDEVIDTTEEHIASLNTINEYRTEEESDRFLDSDKSYLFPNFTNSVQDNVIIYTLEVKNVSEESIDYKVLPDKLAVHLKFSSVGSGQFPIHYAFYVEVVDGGQLEQEQVEVEVWDNNVVLQFPGGNKDLATFKAWVY